MNLFEIAVQYHVRCELFDRRVCSARSEHGTAMPVDAWERGHVTLNASREMATAYLLGRHEAHVMGGEVMQAIQSEAVHREADRILRGIPDENRNPQRQRI